MRSLVVPSSLKDEQFRVDPDVVAGSKEIPAVPSRDREHEVLRDPQARSACLSNVTLFLEFGKSSSFRGAPLAAMELEG